MISINAQTCDEAWRTAANLVRVQGLEQESRTFRSESTTETLELLHASMTIQNPRQRIVFARSINPAFAIAELIWILAGSNDLEFIKFWNPLMAKFSDDGKTLSGAYGFRLSMNAEGHFDEFLPETPRTSYFMPSKMPFNQLYHAYRALTEVPHSRQVVLQIWSGLHDFPIGFGKDVGKPRSKDIPCNIISDLKVRDGKLHWMQTMRSNDLMWGTPYNFIQWTTLQEIVAGWLGLELGQFTLSTSSLHVYHEHWDELKSLDLSREIPYNYSDLRIKNFENWLPIFKIVLSAAMQFTKASKIDEIYAIGDKAKKVLESFSGDDLANWESYNEWICVLAAEACRKLGRPDIGEVWIEYVGEYWRKSWLQWLERKQDTKNG